MPANTTLRGAIKDIADAIRAKGVSGTMSLNQMPAKIASIPTGSQTKYGVDVDGMIGELDNNGVLQPVASGSTFTFQSSDIEHIPDMALLQKFYQNPRLVSVSLPNLTTCDENALNYAFNGCTNLVSVSMPNFTHFTTTQGDNLSQTFAYCTSLRTVYLNKLSYANWMLYSFDGCTSLELVDFSDAVAIPTASGATFANTNETYKIVVPDALYNDWITSGYWTGFASHIVAKSDYYNT